MNEKRISRLLIEYRPIDKLTPHPNNARIPPKPQLRKLATSIQKFGFVRPVLIDAINQIVAGNGSVEAAKLLGMTHIPTICLADLSEDQIRAYLVADNRLAELSKWDNSVLAVELRHLLTLDSLDFDATVTGFDVPEIDIILQEANGPTEEAEFLEPASGETPISKPGDLWLMVKHKLLCSNSLHDEAYKVLMGNRRAAVVFIDPPFNVKIDGHVSGHGSTHHREFSMASGEMSDAEYVSFLENILRLLARYSESNSLHYICEDWRHVGDLIGVGKQIYNEFVNLCVWTKDQAGMGSLYRSQHELVCVFRNGKGQHRNNVMLGKFGRDRSNVWRYPGIRTLSKQSDEGNLLAMHPTVKPTAMVADALLDCSARGEIVLDSFLGSGTTLMAAERVGRICYGIEIDAAYVDLAVRRWQNQTGEKAMLANSGKCFDEVAARRLATNA